MKIAISKKNDKNDIYRVIGEAVVGLAIGSLCCRIIESRDQIRGIRNVEHRRFFRMRFEVDPLTVVEVKTKAFTDREAIDKFCRIKSDVLHRNLTPVR